MGDDYQPGGADEGEEEEDDEEGAGGAAAGSRRQQQRQQQQDQGDVGEEMVELEEEDAAQAPTAADLDFIDDDGVDPEARVDFGDDDEEQVCAASWGWGGWGGVEVEVELCCRCFLAPPCRGFSTAGTVVSGSLP